jgi:flagellar hook-associated protein 3 FlgL
MRITNNMITNNTKNNINSNKISVDKYNTQMTTQKKISKASDDPVIAIRSLRLSTSLNHIDQYVDNNIPDAEAWLDVTYTALNNMLKLVTDIHTQCVDGSTDTLTADDRQTILKSLTSMADQIYTEGNADYSGRTIFTGYRTSSNLTFDTDEEDTTYQISQSFSYSDMEEHRYYTGNVEVPTNVSTSTPLCDTEVGENTYDRIRLAYDEIGSVDGFSYSYGSGDAAVSVTTVTEADGSMSLQDGDGNVVGSYTVYDTETDWEDASGKTLSDNDVIFIKQTGEFIFGDSIASNLESNKAAFDITYTKTGFDSGELRPEYYFDCVDKSDAANPVTYTKSDQQIQYTIATNTTLTVNTQASDVFSQDIQRDTNEMINIVQKAITAHDKVDQITAMMKESKYADEDSQATLQTYLDAAQKEADYADDNLQKTYEQYITNFDNYMTKINTAITNVGSMQNRLAMTQTRVENQQTTIQELKSSNEDRDISDIIIDYYAAYNAYQASLTAASKVGDQTLLNYL